MKVSPPSMMRGGGGLGGAETRGEVTAGFNRETWNVGWILFMVGGSLSWTAVGLMMRVTMNGPTYRGASFRVPPRMGMSLVESHTRWPTRYSGAGFLFLSACCFIQAAAFCRLARVTLQVRLHLRMNASADWTPTCSS